MDKPKDYSSVYCEEKPQPVPATRGAIKTLDGSFTARRHRESGIDPNDLVSRLYNLSREQHKAYAMNTLQQHYSNVFQKRNKQQTYKVCIDYMDNGQQRERYLVRIQRNILREVKAKLPIKGDYRLFFIHAGNECEEVEDDESILPYHEKDGAFVIYCRAFAK